MSPDKRLLKGLDGSVSSSVFRAKDEASQNDVDDPVQGSRPTLERPPRGRSSGPREPSQWRPRLPVLAGRIGALARLAETEARAEALESQVARLEAKAEPGRGAAEA